MTLLHYLNTLFSKTGFKINRVVKTDSILKNVFGSIHSKRALVSYLREPFLEGMKYHHSSYMECHTAATVLHELGYSVDVVTWNDNDVRVNYAEYAIVYGFGYPLEKAFYSNQAEEIVKVFYSSGCNPFYSNKVSTLKVLDFYKRKKVLIPQSSRVLQEFFSFEYLLSDIIVALGNQFVVDTYLSVNPEARCFPISAFYFDIYDIDVDKKDYSAATSHYLWFGSSGLLHKGLDLAIDYFAANKDVYLHICGASQDEVKFFQYYQPVIDANPNIINHGFVDIRSDSFKKMMDTCGFVLFPSVSEGGAVSLLNVMANGAIIPIAPLSTGLDIGEIGIVLNECTIEGVHSAMQVARSLDKANVKQRSAQVKKNVRTQFTYSLYKERLGTLLRNQLSELKKI